jgi:hypothetical protein
VTPIDSGKQKRRSTVRRPEKPSGRRRFLIASTVVLAVGIAVAVMLVRGATGGFEMLQGRWQRPDGGYIIDIRGVDPSGKIDAVYLNPKLINVARAEATRDGSTLKVAVELRAPNYPGSTYTLTYDPQQDQLQGTYFQAALQQSFSVFFVRLKSE